MCVNEREIEGEGERDLILAFFFCDSTHNCTVQGLPEEISQETGALYSLVILEQVGLYEYIPCALITRGVRCMRHTPKL